MSLKNLRESQWALLGINQRAYQLTMATIQQLNEGNFVACGHCIRGIIETFSSIVWVEKKPSRLPSLVKYDDQPSIGKLLNSAYKAYPPLKERYQFWSSVTHPARNSHLLCAPGMAATKRGLIWPISFGFSEHFTSLILGEILIVCPRINNHIYNFIKSNNETLKTGKIMVSTKPR